MSQNTHDAAELEIQAAAAILKVAPLASDAQAQLVGCLAGRLAEAKALIAERESRLANIKFLLEPIYGSTNYAPIGGTLDRVLNICDRFGDAETLRGAVEMLLTAIAETGEQYPNLETETWNAVRFARAALKR